MHTEVSVLILCVLSHHFYIAGYEPPIARANMSETHQAFSVPVFTFSLSGLKMTLTNPFGKGGTGIGNSMWMILGFSAVILKSQSISPKVIEEKPTNYFAHLYPTKAACGQGPIH